MTGRSAHSRRRHSFPPRQPARPDRPRPRRRRQGSCTRSRVSLAQGQGPGRKPGASLYTRKRLSLSVSQLGSGVIEA